MSLQVGRLLTYLLVTCVYVCRGLHLTFDRTPDNQFCALLRCGEKVSQSDTEISHLNELSVYNITLAQQTIRLASVSISKHGLYVDTSKCRTINGTGNISSREGHLALSFQDVADCLHGTFLCQLDFVTVNGQPGTTTVSTISGDSGDCLLLGKLLTERLDNLKIENIALKVNVTQLLSEKLKLQSNVTQLLGEKLDLQSNVTQLLGEKLDLQSNITQLLGEKLDLKSNVTQLLDEKLDLQSKANYLQSSLENVTQRNAVLEALVNASINNPEVPRCSCLKGMQSVLSNLSSQEFFLLWCRVPTLCDTETDGGGWVIIQRRTKGDEQFYRGWTDYKNGFGSPDSDFWIGLNVIHNLTTKGYTELRFDMHYNGKKYFAQYSHFTVADEHSKYRLSVGEYNGTAGDSFTHHSGNMFSTHDNDNDVGLMNCALTFHGAWWYKSCYQSNLNGHWGSDSDAGVNWNALTDSERSLSFIEMKVRQE
ncbi:hypothetical protein BsWGS_07569 [Bradybaena similaris]